MAIKTIQNFSTITELIAVIFASIYFSKYKNTPAKQMLLALWLIALTEILGWLMAEKKILLYENKYSYWLYNLMSPTWKSIYLFIYLKALKTPFFKKCIRYFIISYFIIIPINWFFIQNFFTELDNIPYIVSSFFIIISTIFYLLELLRSDKIIIFHRKLLFWVSIGLLIFHTGIIPFTLMTNYYSQLNFVHNLYLIIHVLGLIMYLIFTFGFIWSKKE